MMETMNGWDVAVLAIAGYVAVVSLARLMLRRRDELVVEFRALFQQEKRKKAELERKKAEQERHRPAA
ncbi:MAG: hypothetical protein NTW96_17210 [Planctomycetia bacterium]|nr:hypothetical protein [Planctomycetia bacterium]